MGREEKRGGGEGGMRGSEKKINKTEKEKYHNRPVRSLRGKITGTGPDTVRTYVPSLDRRIFFLQMQICVGKMPSNLYLSLFLCLFHLFLLIVLHSVSEKIK